jgi:hypothetical protein
VRVRVWYRTLARSTVVEQTCVTRAHEMRTTLPSPKSEGDRSHQRRLGNYRRLLRFLFYRPSKARAARALPSLPHGDTRPHHPHRSKPGISVSLTSIGGATELASFSRAFADKHPRKAKPGRSLWRRRGSDTGGCNQPKRAGFPDTTHTQRERLTTELSWDRLTPPSSGPEF